MTTRRAVIRRSRSGRPAVDEAAAYLPQNYKVVDQDKDTITIEGEDFAGWTLDGYVIPRLGSGLIFAEEVPADVTA